MDEAFSRMLDLLNEADSGDGIEESATESRATGLHSAEPHSADYDQRMLNLCDDIKQIEVPTFSMPTPASVVTCDFDPENNIMDDSVQCRFIDNAILDQDEDSLFTTPQTTTITLGGYLSNVYFHEEELIKELIPSEEIPVMRCNYGKLVYPGYIEPTRMKKTNRGRKKKLKKKKQRKVQGAGTDFNSQITFVVRSTLEPPVGTCPGMQDYYYVPTDSKVYKIKIFRTGKIQLPGIVPQNIEDVIKCTNKIVQMLNFHLHPGVKDQSKLVKIVNINPIMKNYKFVMKLAPGELVDMSALKRIMRNEQLMLADERYADSLSEILKYHTSNADNDITVPEIFDVKYTREDTRVSMKFNTPIYRKPKKKTRFNLFMMGKINILGAFDIEMTRNICEFLRYVFEKYHDKIVVRTLTAGTEYNILHHETPGELVGLMRHMNTFAPELPSFTEAEYEAFVDVVNRHWDAYMADFGASLRTYFAVHSEVL